MVILLDQTRLIKKNNLKPYPAACLLLWFSDNPGLG